MRQDDRSSWSARQECMCSGQGVQQGPDHFIAGLNGFQIGFVADFGRNHAAHFITPVIGPWGNFFSLFSIRRGVLQKSPGPTIPAD